MKTKAILANLIFMLAALLCVVPVGFCQLEGQDNDPHMTGLIRPAPLEREKELKTILKLKKVHLNKLGLQRVNAQMLKKGMFTLGSNSAVPFGSEIEASVGEPETAGLQPTLDAGASANIPSGALPAYIDNSQLKYFPPIRSQGSLGSCASWASAYYAMTHMYAMVRDLDAKNGGDSYRFSPKWTYNMLNGGANAGTWHYDAYRIGIKHGLATWAEFPYDGSDYRGWCLDPAVWRNAISRRFQQYGYASGVNTDTGLAQVKQLLVNGYVLNFATYISSWQFKTIANDPLTAADDAFVGKQIATMVNGTSGGHAMTIVGYNDDIWVDLNNDSAVQPQEKGAFRIANSWGTGWGESGFCWLAYQALRTRNPASSSEGIFWYDETCWVTARPAYSPQLIAEFTLNHLKRDQLQMTLGISDTGKTAPLTTWYPAMLSRQGGPYAFDGSTVACDATFALDFTELLPTDGSLKRYYVGMYDGLSGSIATLKASKVIDLNNGAVVYAADVPKTADASQVYSFLDYQYGNSVPLPVAQMSAAPTSGYAPLAVSFDGTRSYATGGNITAYNWDFGDGATATGGMAAHTYANYGIFTASLNVTDFRGFASDPVATTIITVQDNNQAPVAEAGATPVSGVVPLSVVFSGSGSYDPDGTITSYSWNFGDGASASGVSATHTYNSSGPFTAKLTVFDNKGTAGAATMGITVDPDPNLLVSPTNLAATVSKGTVALRWQDNSNNEQGFYVERGIRAKGGKITYQRIGSAGANVTVYNDTVSSNTYYYRIQAYNLTTNKTSGYSNEIQVRVAKR